jgi:hypothetical protein
MPVATYRDMKKKTNKKIKVSANEMVKAFKFLEKEGHGKVITVKGKKLFKWNRKLR